MVNIRPTGGGGGLSGAEIDESMEVDRQVIEQLKRQQRSSRQSSDFDSGGSTIEDTVSDSRFDTQTQNIETDPGQSVNVVEQVEQFRAAGREVLGSPQREQQALDEFFGPADDVVKRTLAPENLRGSIVDAGEFAIDANAKVQRRFDEDKYLTGPPIIFGAFGPKSALSGAKGLLSTVRGARQGTITGSKVVGKTGGAGGAGGTVESVANSVDDIVKAGGVAAAGAIAAVGSEIEPGPPVQEKPEIDVTNADMDVAEIPVGDSARNAPEIQPGEGPGSEISVPESGRGFDRPEIGIGPASASGTAVGNPSIGGGIGPQGPTLPEPTAPEVVVEDGPADVSPDVTRDFPTGGSSVIGNIDQSNVTDFEDVETSDIATEANESDLDTGIGTGAGAGTGSGIGTGTVTDPGVITTPEMGPATVPETIPDVVLDTPTANPTDVPTGNPTANPPGFPTEFPPGFPALTGPPRRPSRLRFDVELPDQGEGKRRGRGFGFFEKEFTNPVATPEDILSGKATDIDLDLDGLDEGL